jgi:glutathione synthase
MLIRGRTLFLHGMEVGPDDIVWLRLDPSVSVAWYEALRALCHVDARIVNPPDKVLTVHDKRSALSLCPRPTWSLFSAAQMRPVAGEMRRMGVETVVLKPPSLFASKGVKYIPVDDGAALDSAFSELVGLFGYVIAEPYLGPGGGRPPVDLRVLVTPRRVIGAIERVIPVGGGLHDVTKARPFTPDQARLVAAAMAYMRDEGLFLAGLDFLGDALTELNVSCPGAIPEINMFCGITAEDEVLDDLQAF